MCESSYTAELMHWKACRPAGLQSSSCCRGCPSAMGCPSAFGESLLALVQRGLRQTSGAATLEVSWHVSHQCPVLEDC